MANRCKACGWLLSTHYAATYGAFAHFAARPDCVKYYQEEGWTRKIEPKTPEVILDSLHIHKDSGLWMVSAIGMYGQHVTYFRSVAKGRASIHFEELQRLIHQTVASRSTCNLSPLSSANSSTACLTPV